MKKLRIWFKGVLKKFVAIPCYCKKCGIDIRDFRVDPEIWFAIESGTKHVEYRGERAQHHTELCFNCFSDVCCHLGIDFSDVWYLVPGPIERGEVLCKLQIAKDPDDGVCPLYSGCVDGNGKRRIVNIAESCIVYSHHTRGNEWHRKPI